MDNKLVVFKKIIRECMYENTYKMALAKALVEISAENKYVTDPVVITPKEIAFKFFKYYWNQTIYFDLIQGSNLKKPPEVYSSVKSFIEIYYAHKGNRKPERFERAEDLLLDKLKKEYDNVISGIAKTICKDVARRFTSIDNRHADEIFVFDITKKEFVISIDVVNLLKENKEDLYDLINYRWGLILETFNSSPRINKKVKIIDQKDIKRGNLNKFKVYLDAQNPNRRCFICGNEINEKELSIDHVIPWSYLYSDDLWNLVYVHKACNSVKSNAIPQAKEIKKLKERNESLIHVLKEKGLQKKYIDELEVAIEKDYVDKF